MRTTSTLAPLVFLFCLIPALAGAQVYTIRDLGPLSPTGINSWGQVVGNYNNQAYIWTFGRMRPLGTLTGGTFSRAASINDLGVVTGTADGHGTVISPDPDVPDEQCDDLTQPFVWTLRTGMQGIGTRGIVGLFSVGDNCNYAFYGRDINVSGEIVGDVPVSGNFYAFGFVWTSTAGMSLYGGSWPPTFANAVSNTGLIVGQNSLSLEGPGEATTWGNGSIVDLGTLGSGTDSFFSSANGVNERGQIVGWSTTGPIYFFSGNNSPVHAVLWNPSQVIQDVGTLPGDISSAAVKVNFFGQVIGSSGNTLYALNDDASSPFEVTGRPFIWSERSGMQDLNTLIRGNSGWVLNSATDINVWGQIVGEGMLNGQPHGFLLTPRNPF